MTPTTEELAAELDELGTHMALGPNQSATLRAAAARLRELSEALKPFGEASCHLHPSHPDDGLTLDGIEVRHWRRAGQLTPAQLTETHSD